MPFHSEHRIRILYSMLLVLSTAICGLAGVSRAIQEQYKQEYENKVLFLKTPIYSVRQVIYVSGQGIREDRGTEQPLYNVGDQLRVHQIDFGSDEIKFKMGEITGPSSIEIQFKFDGNLQEGFPQRASFDRALQATLTEGLKYTEIEDAKNRFIDQEFERSVKEIAGAASAKPAAVLDRIASHVPAYEEAQRQIETLKGRVKDLSSQLSESQSSHRKLQSEFKRQEAEVDRLKGDNAALQEKIDSFAAQVSRLGEENRNIRGNAQGYQKELESIQRSLNLKVDSSRDLSMQIADLGQAMVQLQKENQIQTQRIGSLQAGLEAQQAVNKRLSGDNEDLKGKNHKLQSTINTLTSNKDSLARKYLNLKNEKDKLDEFFSSVDSLRSSTVEEKNEGGNFTGKANIYLKNFLIGILDWKIPLTLNQGQNKSAEANITAESVDTVKMTPEERQILRSFGERLKIGLSLSTSSVSMEVTQGKGEPVQEVAERERSAWQWNITNHGTQDARVLLSARLINKDSYEIPLFQQGHSVMASNPVRQIRSYLRPIPVAVGAILGFLLFGIVGIFRRPKSRKGPASRPPSGPSEDLPYNHQKQL